MRIIRKFWPLDSDPEGEIYDSPAWDLPGFRGRRVPIAVPEAPPVRGRK